MTRLAWNEMSSKSRQFLPWQSALYLEPQLALKIRVPIFRTIWITCDLLVDAFVVDHVLLMPWFQRAWDPGVWKKHLKVQQVGFIFIRLEGN